MWSIMLICLVTAFLAAVPIWFFFTRRKRLWSIMLKCLMTACLAAVSIWFFFTRRKSLQNIISDRPIIIREDADEYRDPNELRIVLIGKTGSGKSSTGNTILGKTKDNGGFKDMSGQNSCTRKCERIKRVINKQTILVIDTPGVYDTGRSTKEVEHEIIRCLFLCAPGPHAVLFVVKGNERFTEEEANAYSALKTMFGNDIKKHIIVVVTGGDILSQEGKTIEGEWDAADSAISMKSIVDDVSNRYIVFSNKGDNATRDKQVLNLLKMVTDMVNKNESYFENKKTRAVWREVERSLRRIMLKKMIDRKKKLKQMKQQLLQRKTELQRSIEIYLASRLTLQNSEKKYACRILQQKLQQEHSKGMEVEVLRIMQKKPELNIKQACAELMPTLEQKENAWEKIEGELKRVIQMEPVDNEEQAWTNILQKLHQNEHLDVTKAEMQWIQEEVGIIEKEAWAELQQDVDSLVKKSLPALLAGGCAGLLAATYGIALAPVSGAVLIGAATGEAARRVCLIM